MKLIKNNNQNKKDQNNDWLNQLEKSDFVKAFEEIEVEAISKIGRGETTIIGSEKISLGREAKSSSTSFTSTYQDYDEEAHELRLNIRKIKSRRQNEIRKYIYKLQQKGQIKKEFESLTNALLTCGKAIIKYQAVGLFKTQKTGVAHYSGLAHCDNVHSCPYCGARINEQRRKQIELAINEAYKLGLIPFMLTLTFPHTRKMPLIELLDKQALALKHFRSGRFWQNIKKRYNIKGLIRALEVNNSQANGWHPHTHELHFANPLTQQQAEELTEIIFKHWEKCCIKSGLINQNRTKKEKDAFREHSVDIKINCSASDYLTKSAMINGEEIQIQKWGVDRELASRSTKEGRAKGRTIWQLIDEGRMDLYMEYVEAMKNKASIYINKFINDLIKEAEKKEEEAKTEEEKEAETPRNIMWFERSEWYLIWGMNAQNKILWFAELPLSFTEIEQKIRAYLVRLERLKKLIEERYRQKSA